MSTYYVDTSALIKRYLTEPESAWVRTITDPQAGNVIIICDLTAVEFSSALARRVREGSITRDNALILQSRFPADVEREYHSVPLENPVLEIARELPMVSSHPLRSLDSIQLASAIAGRDALGEPIMFVSSDKGLLAVSSEIFDLFRS